MKTKIVETHILCELEHPYTLRKVYVTEDGDAYLELPGGLWPLTEEEFEKMKVS